MLHQTSRFLTKEYAGTIEVVSKAVDASSILCGAYISYQLFDIPVEGTDYLPLLVLIKILFCFIISNVIIELILWRSNLDDYSVKKYFGGCPHDCPDTCAMVYEVENKKLIARQD